jgi:hypothetical protein
MKIFELRQEQQILLDRLFWCEPEDNEADIIRSELNKIDGAIDRKLSFLTSVLAESIALSKLSTEAKKIAQERLERKEKKAKRAEEKLREFILSVMKDFDIKKVEGDILNVSRYERDVVIQLQNFDIDKLPSNLVKVTKVIDKKAINDEFKHGIGIEGFELVKKDCLRIF